MRGPKLILIYLAALLFPFISYPQFALKNFYSLSGKKDVTIRCAAQDENGFLWIGSAEGLLRFDGRNTMLFKKEDGLSDPKVTAVFAGAHGSIWAGTDKGKVYILRHGRIDSLNFGKTAPAARITSLYVSPQEAVFISTYGDGIYVKTKNGLLHLGTENGLSDNVVYNMLFSNGKLWCGTDAGISILSDLDSKPVCSIFSHKEGLPDNIVRNISSDHDRLLISMQDSGVCRYDPATKKTERLLSGSWTFGAVVNAYDDDDGLVIATEKNGLISVNKKQVNLQDYRSGISASSVNAFFKDGTGNFWLCSQKGLHLLYRKRYELINTGAGLKTGQVTAIAEGDNDLLWIGTQSGVQKIVSSASGETEVLNEDRISGITISCIAKGPDGSIWFGTYSNGIEVLDPASGRLVTLNSKTGGLPNDNVSMICFDKNKIYISTLGGGLIEAEATPENGLKILKVYTENDGLGSNYVYASLTDANGNLYAASDGGGLEVRENGSFKNLSSRYKLRSNTVYSLCKDAAGNIWAVSNDDGILKYDGKTMKSINQKSGLRDEQPQQLFAYGNTVFAIHSRGIDKINTLSDSISYYDVFDGDLEPNLNAIGFDNTRFYSGTNNGVLVYRYAPQPGDTARPRALITRLQINYRTFPTDSLWEFSPGQNNISLGFEGVWLRNPDKLSFRYRLLGFEDKWNYSNEGKMVNYNNLDAGSYSFVVQSKNEEDVWSRESVYAFTIPAPVWKKWWFWALVLIGAGSAIYFFLQYRLKNLQRENTLLEEKVKERTHEIEKQAAIIEEKSKELELLSLVASRTDNVVLILDAEGRMEYVNESFVRLNKITLEELRKKGNSIFEISNNPDIRAIVEDAVNNRHSVKYEALNKVDETTEVWEASTLTPIFNEQGELKKIIIIDSDVTESKRQERIIVQKNKDITDSIEYARKIQTAILPADALIRRCLPQSFVLYKTKDIVSGDFYWFTEKEDCSVIAAVDCTGHGVPGAFMSLIGYNILNRIVNEQGQTDPGLILKELNNGVLEALNKNRTDSIDGMDIAICRIHHNSNRIDYAGAMRPLLIVSPSDIKEVRADKIPIGTMPQAGKIISYTTHSLQLEKEETAYVFTDGYADQFGGPKGKKLSTARFKEFLLKYHGLDMPAQHDMLLKEHLAWKGDNEQVDDILVIGFKAG